jgi:hypothetical protein
MDVFVLIQHLGVLLITNKISSICHQKMLVFKLPSNLVSSFNLVIGLDYVSVQAVIDGSGEEACRKCRSKVFEVDKVMAG